MTATNFAALMTDQKRTWSRELWKNARNLSFIHQFAGKGNNAMVQRIVELTKTEKGTKAVLTLLADLTGDGIMGDATLEGNEEAIKIYDQEVTLDQLRNANRTTGRLNDQKSIVNFREASRDVLAYWLADRMDQLAFLTLSGIAYTLKNNGATRPVLATGQNFSDLEFAADVSAPTSNRVLCWDTSADTFVGTNATLTAADTLQYRTLVKAKAFAKDQYIRGIRGPGGEEIYHVFVTPQGMADLKLDADYLANVRSAGVRGGKNPLFAGTSAVMVDGLIIHEFRHVYNTSQAAGGSKWGAASAIDGQRVLMCGAQALGMADIDVPTWEEEDFDYKNQIGIATAKIFGLLKPLFNSNVTSQDEDFGVLCIDTAINP